MFLWDRKNFPIGSAIMIMLGIGVLVIYCVCKGNQ